MWIGKGERAPAALSGPRPAIAAAGDEMEELFLYFTFVYDWVNVLQLIAVSFSVVLVLSSLSLTGRGLIRFGIQAACVFAAETLFNWLLFYLSHYLKWLAGINFPLAHLIVIAVYAAFVSRYNIKSRFVLSATVFVTAIVMAELGTQCMRLFASGGGAMQIFAAGADVLIVGFAVLINLRSIHIYDNIPKTSVASIITVAAASTALVLVAEVDSVANNMTADGNLCLMLLYIYLVTVAAYIITYHHCTDHNAKLVLEVDKKLMEADIKMLSLSEQVAEEMKEVRHDIKNQFLMMDMMLREKRYGEMEEYFKNMKEDFVAFPHFTDCGNASINSIMNMESLKAASKKVQIISKINVPAELPVSVNDLCRIFVNLLDNAIEASEKTVGEGKRIVDLNVHVQNDYLYISVTNPIADSVDRAAALNLNTTKSDYKNHGYGHRIVKKIVDKYNGYINYSIEGDEFIAEAMLDIKTEAKHDTN